MAYSTVANVEKLMQVNFTHGSGRPTYEDVEEMIDDVAADLDGVAQAAGYTVPITSTSGVALMRKYNTYGAAVAAWHAGFVSDTEPARVEFWRSQYEQFIARLRRGEQQLPSEEPESDLDPVFEIVEHPPRDRYWTGEDEGL